jgi:hypothetical protein
MTYHILVVEYSVRNLFDDVIRQQREVMRLTMDGVRLVLNSPYYKGLGAKFSLLSDREI